MGRKSFSVWSLYCFTYCYEDLILVGIVGGCSLSLLLSPQYVLAGQTHGVSYSVWLALSGVKASQFSLTRLDQCLTERGLCLASDGAWYVTETTVLGVHLRKQLSGLEVFRSHW